MKYEVKFTSQFKKDLKLAKKQHKNLDDLANDVSIDPKYKGHSLTGNFISYRECHIELY